MKFKYGLTIKPLKNPMHAKTIDLYCAMHILKHKTRYGMDISHYSYELSPKGVLHLHALVTLDRKEYRKKLKVKGYNTFFNNINDEQGWKRYCNKDAHNKYVQEQICLYADYFRNYDMLNNSFDMTPTIKSQ